MKLKLFILTILTVLGLSLPLSSYAGTLNLSVRLGQPKTPTNQDNFKLTFVALEIGGTENITVDCYKKSFSDADYVMFETKTLIPGGNTDYCSVTNSILNANGTYHFKVRAKGILESNVVIVDYNTSGPSTPVSYSKERLNDCDYKIKFKTADDGRTVKVELFRSDTKSISLDASSRVASPSIAPNTEGEITNSVPVCGKEYFYVIRAVDNYGNVSGTTGDSFTTTTGSTTTTETTQGALPVGESQVPADETVVGETTEATGEGQTLDETGGTPEVLGAEETKPNYLKWLSIPLLLIAVYFFLKSKKRA